ncbi:MAG: 30S ribosome-binding factor RbfA [Verrucomicrobia bacterium]|nr:30S ribosome-binding factor RbfA [Verrucomicrobiota bacterium]
MSKRLLRVNELLKRELGNYISRELEFSKVLVSVHGVEITPNLKQAKVFIGVIGDDRSIQAAIDKLNHNRVAMQSYIGKRVTMKFTPRLEFCSDDSIERGVRVLSLLEEIAEEETAAPDDEPDRSEESDERD